MRVKIKLDTYDNIDWLAVRVVAAALDSADDILPEIEDDTDGRIEDAAANLLLDIADALIRAMAD